MYIYPNRRDDGPSVVCPAKGPERPSTFAHTLPWSGFLPLIQLCAPLPPFPLISLSERSSDLRRCVYFVTDKAKGSLASGGLPLRYFPADLIPVPSVHKGL